jgi:large subunit ribosomal protein L21
MNLAIIESGGKQYLVMPKSKIQIEKIEGKAGDAVSLDKVLFSSKDGAISTGAPLVKNSVVTATILKQSRSKKILVFKYKAKSKYRRKQGHRQHYTELEIITI